MHTHLTKWLTYFYAKEIKFSCFKRWLNHFKSIADFFAHQEEWPRLGITESQIRQLKKPEEKNILFDLNWAEKKEQTILCLDDENYPALLKAIPDPPPILFVKGNINILQGTQLALVGARHAKQQALVDAHYFARELAKAGLVITSGLALGIDGASHQGALSAPGKTIAVLGNGLTQCYPAIHQKLAHRILEAGGALVSELPLAAPPLPFHFPKRNRIIAGLSVGVLVIRATLKSGSLITAHHALEYGREVFAVPGSIHDPLMRGCHALIRQGAKLVESLADIFEEIGGFSLSSRLLPSSAPSLTASEQQFLLHLEEAPVTFPHIIARSGLTASEVSSMLLALELRGVVKSVPGGYVRVNDLIS